MKFRKPKSEDRAKSESGRPEFRTERNSAAEVGGRVVAFSLIEILVVVGLLSVIILGLLAMFAQTQRALRTGLTQTDVLQAGRLTSEMLGRELEQITPAYQPGMNFYAQIPNDATYNTPFMQPLPGGSIARMNLIHDLFFVSKNDQYWVAVGYFVRVNNPQNGTLSLSPLGVGNLYRFETNVHVLSTSRTVASMFDEFWWARTNENLVINGTTVNRATKLAEGVIHFKVRTFNTNGTWIVATNQGLSFFGTNTSRYPANVVGNEIELYSFTSNAVPGAVELELGILEDKTWQRYKALPAIGSPPNAREKFLTNQVGRVHLFRQRVAVRNLDPIAYQ